MKLNLPTTWTSPKINVLLLMTWLSVRQAKAGKGFENCLVDHNDFTSYNALIGYPFGNNNAINNGYITALCCGSTQCSTLVSPSFNCNDTKDILQCFKIPQTKKITCMTLECGGNIDNLPITFPITLNSCQVSIKDIENILVSDSDSWDVGNLTINESRGYANLDCLLCAGAAESMRCNWDNGGWTCFSSEDVMGYDDKKPTCYLQWPASFPSLRNTTSSASTTSVSSTSAGLNTPTILSSGAQSTKKIIIPIDTIVGTITIGGITYYLYKKRKWQSNHQKEAEEKEVPNVNLAEVFKNDFSSQVRQPQNDLRQQLIEFQTQIQVPPK